MAANSIAKLAVLITGDASPLRVATQSAANSIQQFANGAKGAGAAGASSLAGITAASAGTAAAVAAVAAALIGFGRAGIAAAANIEQLRISLEVMTGSASTAMDLSADMQKLSAETPLDMSGIQQAGKTLMAMGEPTEAIISDLKMLGDIAAGTGQPLNELAQVFGQVMQAGRLTGNELRQFNERGVPLMSALAEQLGVSKARIREMVEASQIGSLDVVHAFEAMTGAGGKFANMMERQTDTLIGQWNKFKENLTLIASNTMAPIATAMKEILMSFNEVLDSAMKFAGFDRTGSFKTSDKAKVDAIREQAVAQQKAEEAAAKADDAAKKRQQDMASRAQSLAQSLRTPFEVMTEAMQEASQLMQEGLLGPEMFERAVAKISAEYRKASESAKNFKNEVRFAPALEWGTQAARTAALSARGGESSREAEKIARESLAVERRIAAATEAALRKPTVSFKLGQLN